MKMRLYILVPVFVHGLSACSTKRNCNSEQPLTFCQKKYGLNASVDWVIKGEQISNGVADKIAGFRCSFREQDSNRNSHADVTCERHSGENFKRCMSPQFEAKLLCANDELKQYWESPGFAEDICGH
jgi:hypothetical protein